MLQERKPTRKQEAPVLQAPPTAVARVGEIPPGQTKKFFLQVDGREVECFVVNYGGELFAYVNRCRHVPMTMDWIENQFLTEDGRYILCATHGAAFEPDTGECVFGPPCGKFLDRVPLIIEADHVIAQRPIEEED
ncbi:MAG: Rieske 2Fe-2S domain-containing protein [Deltaproteobacteria bacterium]|nr:Rieske 2Fe-2S domain-containing protein [Deltaproteobacteria bacterium]